MDKLFVGIDVSKSSFDVCGIDENEKILFQDKFEIDNDGFNSLLSKLPKPSDKVIIVMESTAIYHLTLLSFLLTHLYKTAVVNPFLIKNFIASDTLRKSKNDKKDALHIAKFALEKNRKITFFNINSLNTIKPLLREKENLIKDSSRTKIRIKSVISQVFPELEHKDRNIFSDAILRVLEKYPNIEEIKKASLSDLDKLLTKRVKITGKELKELAQNSIGISDKALSDTLKSKIRVLKCLNEELKTMDKLLEKYIEEDESSKKNIEILESIPGIGEGTSKSFLIEIESISRFSSVKKLTAYIGIDPSFYQSGEIEIRGKISKRGNKYLRLTLWQMANNMILQNEKFRLYYQKKMQEGKKYNQAIIAVANKLLRTIYVLLSNQKMYDKKIALAK